MKKIIPVILLLISTCMYASPGKILVVYYSWSGNTQKIAHDIHALVGGDLLLVKVTTPYTAKSDQDLYPVAAREIKAIDNNGIYPEITAEIDSLDKYDTIFICYPLWHSRMATPMQSFLNKYGNKMAGKTVALFCTSASSEISETIEDARRLCPEANILSALWIRANQIDESHEKVVEWLKSNNLYSANGSGETKMNLIIGNKTFVATLNNSQAAEVFKTLLPMTVDMTDLNNNEKFCWLTTDFPGAAVNPGLIQTGDLMIWSSRCFVIYYKTFNTSYSFIKIGQIDDVTGLAEAVGSGDVTVKVELASTTDVGSINETPTNFTLEQNYPNPFNPVTRIRFSLPNNEDNAQQYVHLKVYDILGREIITLVNEYKTAGIYEIKFDGSQLSSGVYLYNLETDKYRESKKLVLIK